MENEGPFSLVKPVHKGYLQIARFYEKGREKVKTSKIMPNKKEPSLLAWTADEPFIMGLI
jgi:hypothetical protein